MFPAGHFHPITDEVSQELMITVSNRINFDHQQQHANTIWIPKLFGVFTALGLSMRNKHTCMWISSYCVRLVSFTDPQEMGLFKTYVHKNVLYTE